MISETEELFGFNLTIKANLEHFRNRVVLVKTDDKVTHGYIDHLGARFVFLSGIAHDRSSMCYL